MDNRSESMSWFGSIYQQIEDKIEAMCLEVDGFMQQQQQEGFTYVENKLQTAGASVKKFCSDVVQDFLPQYSENSVQGAAYESPSAQNSDEADKLLKEGISEDQLEKEPCNLNKEGISEDQLEKEPCNLNQLDRSGPKGPENIAGYYLTVQDIIDQNIWIKENPSEEQQLQLDIADGVSLDKSDPSLSVLFSSQLGQLESSSYEDNDSVASVNSYPSMSVSFTTSDDKLESCFHDEMQLPFEISGGVTSDKKDLSLSVFSPASGGLVRNMSRRKVSNLTLPPCQYFPPVFCGGVLNSEDILGSAESIVRIPTQSDFSLLYVDSASVTGEPEDPIDDITNVGSSDMMELDENCMMVDSSICMMVDSSELSSFSNEAGLLGSDKEKLEALREEEEAAKVDVVDIDVDEKGGCPDSSCCQLEEEGDPVSSNGTATPNHEFCESDWVIV